MRAGSETPRTADPHSLKPVAEARDQVPIPDGVDHFLVGCQYITAIKPNVVSDTSPVALFQLRAAANRLCHDLDARFRHDRPSSRTSRSPARTLVPLTSNYATGPPRLGRANVSAEFGRGLPRRKRVRAIVITSGI